MPEFKDKFYVVHSGGRDQESRARRGRSGGHRFVQKLAGGAVIVRYRRPATVSAELLARHLPEFVREWRAGHLEVRTKEGGLVDLVSGDVSLEIPVTPPGPNVPLDSAANDLSFPAGVGQHIATFDGGLGEGETGVVPDLLEKAKMEADAVSVESNGDPVAARRSQRGKKG